MIDEVPTNQRTTDEQERFVNIGASFVTDTKSPVTVEPCERAFNDPSVTPKSLATLDTTARDAWCDASPPQLGAQCFRVIRFIGVQFHGTPAGSAASPSDGRDGIHGFHHHLRVMDVCGAHRDGERDALSVHDQMAFRARFAAIRWIRPGFIAPFCDPTDEESSEARDQSIRSASPKWSSKVRWSRRHTPASCHSRSLRQHVMPEPQPISGGRYSHGNPVASTNRMPRNTSRFGVRGRPPRGFSASGGSNGSMTAHSSSVINCFAMH